MLFWTFLNCMYYVSYRVSYRDNCIEICIVSWQLYGDTYRIVGKCIGWGLLILPKEGSIHIADFHLSLLTFPTFSDVGVFKNKLSKLNWFGSLTKISYVISHMKLEFHMWNEGFNLWKRNSHMKCHISYVTWIISHMIFLQFICDNIFHIWNK